MTVPKYLISRLLVISLVLIALSAKANSINLRLDCDQLVVNVKVNSLNNVVLEVSGIKGKQILHVIGFGGFLRENINPKDLNSLGKGSYVLIVVDQLDSENFCHKQIDFTIQ